MKVELRREARADIADAARWYEDRKPGLGAAFVREVDALLGRIAKAPERFRQLDDRLRVALSNRFPYSVFFAVEPARVVVIAVLHQRRDQRILKTRPN